MFPTAGPVTVTMTQILSTEGRACPLLSGGKIVLAVTKVMTKHTSRSSWEKKKHNHKTQLQKNYLKF